MTDDEILATIGLDPESGMRQLLATHGSALLGRLKAHARDRSYGDLNVEDILQEALLRLIDPDNRAELRSAGGSILPWLSRWGYWRLDDASRNSGLPLLEMAQPPMPDDAPASPAVCAMQSVIHLLSPRHRLILRLRYAESRSNAEVAAELGISEGAAKKAGHDGRTRLCALMREAGFDPERGVTR